MFLLIPNEVVSVGTIWSVDIEWQPTLYVKRMKIKHENCKNQNISPIFNENAFIRGHTVLCN